MRNVMNVHPIVLMIASEARCSPTVSLQLLEANSGGATWVFECLLHPKEDVPFEKLHETTDFDFALFMYCTFIARISINWLAQQVIWGESVVILLGGFSCFF